MENQMYAIAFFKSPKGKYQSSIDVVESRDEYLKALDIYSEKTDSKLCMASIGNKGEIDVLVERAEEILSDLEEDILVIP